MALFKNRKKFDSAIMLMALANTCAHSTEKYAQYVQRIARRRIVIYLYIYLKQQLTTKNCMAKRQKKNYAAIAM